MAREALILDRYKPLGTAGAGGFGTVRIAWDPRIQRKVAIKTIELSETDALRAGLPGADANPAFAPVNLASSTAERWHGIQPWREFLEESDAAARADQGPVEGDGAQGADERSAHPREQKPASPGGEPGAGAAGRPGAGEPVTALAHLPGLDEARTAAMLSDSRIVTVFDFEIRGQTAYLIMEYVEGLTLTRLLNDYGDCLTLDMAAAVFDAVAGALSVAHKAGVLHLDIKPDNIIINADGQAKVTDFGLATLADASGAGTTGGGTIGYMPLEQMRREPLDARTDEWSLASLTYEMLTGENPFRAPDLAHAEEAIEEAELVLPSLCWDDIDEQIDDVIFYALDPDPDRRYASVADFAEEAQKFLGDADEGKGQLADIVKAELDPAAEPLEASESVEADQEGQRRGASRRLGLLAWFAGGRARARTAPSADDPELVSPGVDEDEPDYAVPDSRPVPRKARTPLARRVPEHVLSGAARLYAALASGFITAFSLVNVPLLGSVFGEGAAYVIGAAVVVVALAALAVPSVGALVSFLLLAVALLACAHPVVGGVVALAAIAWWLFVGRAGGPAGGRAGGAAAEGHRGMAASNVALTCVPAGAFGAASVVPFASGATLKLVPALATTALAGVLAVVLAAMGSDTLIGWNALSNWDFTHADVSARALSLLARPATWATFAGWLAASAALSVFRRFNARWLRYVGLALALAAVLAGSLIFAAPTPELFVSVILAAAAVALVW